ncbi:MAG: DMT family transporter [Roseicyclus sp.]|nr:DMT family transporter [Roseicyclus sp.]MBO6623588.1 DMT family transporter [Roseicyclus sp.]MBO6923747.1 DMT family transporter [Roseicyclus sp.]
MAVPPIPPVPATPQTAEDRPRAVAFMLVATLFIAATTLLAKALGTDALGPPLHPLQISHGRFLFAFLAIAATVLALRPRLIRPDLKTHIGRTLCGWGGISLMFAAVAFIPLADATAISFLNPVFGMLLAIPLLGERVGPWRWLAAGIALAGMIVLMRPTPESFQPAALLALAAAALMGLELIFIKRLSNREGPLQILFVNNALGLLIASVAVLFVWAAPTPAQWGALVALGLAMACAQACFIHAMRRAEASFVTPFSYLTLVFAGLYDLIIFDVIPDAISLTGAAIIISGAALLAWREARFKRRPRADRTGPPPPP